MSNTKEMAWRLLGRTTDRNERLAIMIQNELNSELITELYALMKERPGCCQIGAFNGPAAAFYSGDSQKAEPGLYPWLEITWDSAQVGVHLEGLLHPFVASPSRDFVQAVLEQRDPKSSTREGNVLAARKYLAGTDLHKVVEIETFRAALSGAGTPGLAIRRLPGGGPSWPHQEIPVDQWLKPIVSYLHEIGVAKETIDVMLLEVLADEANLPNIQKVVAVAGAYSGIAKAGVHEVAYQPLADALARLLPHVIRLQFKDARSPMLTKHLEWLGKYGLWNTRDKLYEVVKKIEPVLVELMAAGNVAGVYQHLVLFDDRGMTRGRVKPGARDLVASLLPKAFKEAMARKNYGVAAALSQLSTGSHVADPEEATLALEMAIVMRQPIRLTWDAYVLPTLTRED